MEVFRQILWLLHAILAFSTTTDAQLYRNSHRGGLNFRQYAALSGRHGSKFPRYRSSYRAALAASNGGPAGTRIPSQRSQLGGNLQYKSVGYGNYLRQLNRGYVPPNQQQQNSVFGYSRYKTGFPLRAPLRGFSSRHSPLPLSAPTLYGYGGYQTDRWSQWSSWSQCSRSCDGGVQERTRNCMSAKLSMTLSLYRGQDQGQGNCPGFSKEFQPCNTSPCISVKSFEDQKYDARKVQCSRFDKKEYLGQKYVWMPYLRDGLNECRLYCMAKGYRMFVELANRVDDGTLCGKSGNKACFSGLCSRAKPRKSPERPVSQLDGLNQHLRQNGFAPSRGIGPYAGSNQRQPSRFAPPNRDPVPRQRPFYPPPRQGTPTHPLVFKGRRPLPPQRGLRPEFPSDTNVRALQGNQRDLLLNRKNLRVPERFVNTRRNEGKPQVVQKVISGTFNSREKLKLGYNLIFKIPVGARNIRIEEARPSPNYLALQVGDKFLINGRWSIALKKDVTAAGTVIRYRLGKGPGTVEILTAAGPITQELQISLLYQQGPPEISFNYTLDVSEPRRGGVFRAAAVSNRRTTGAVRGRNARPTLHWSVAGWTKCSKKCGGGEQNLIIRCVAIYPSKRTKVVRSSYCHSLKKPPQKRRMCNLHPCKAGWVLLPWKPCSKSCGQGGFQTREVRCVRVVLAERGKVEVNAPFYECGPRPAIQKPCQFVPCYSWKSDPWIECSRSCDKGVQTRKSYCTEGEATVDDSFCDKRRKPERARVCNLRPCKTSWFIGEWSQCSEFCGEGFQTRLVFCAGKDGSSLSESLCNINVKPSTKRPCTIKKCDGIWFTSNWTQCSSQCGPGQHSRMVICLSTVNGTMQQVTESHCELSVKPAVTKTCDAGPCNPKWFATDWSHCSRSCGRGIRTRQINCMLKDGQFGRGCQVEKRPNSAMICQVRPCANVIEGSEEAAPTTSQDYLESTATSPTERNRGRTEAYVTALKEAGNSSSDSPARRASPSATAYQSSYDRPGESDNETENYAYAETVVAVPFTKRFSVGKHAVHSKVQQTTDVRTTERSTPAATTKPATTTTIKPESICKNSFKRAYCSAILRIGFCKYTTYRKRCCFSCESGSVR